MASSSPLMIYLFFLTCVPHPKHHPPILLWFSDLFKIFWGCNFWWRRKWQPTSVLLPGKFHGQRNLVGYSPWDHKESDTTERLHFVLHNLGSVYPIKIFSRWYLVILILCVDFIFLKIQSCHHQIKKFFFLFFLSSGPLFFFFFPSSYLLVLAKTSSKMLAQLGGVSIFALFLTFSSVQFSCSVMSDSLRPHEMQHARPPCLSPTPGVYSNSCPSSRWCHPAISSSVVPFSFLTLPESRLVKAQAGSVLPNCSP